MLKNVLASIVISAFMMGSAYAAGADKAAAEEARRMATVVDVPVELPDERLTTVTAERSMLEAGLDVGCRHAAHADGLARGPRVLADRVERLGY